jgi:pimeloyl-ACP methyl ester carboxylesterase
MLTLLLPGLDGTGRLFERFQRALPFPSTAIDYGDATTDEALLACIPLPEGPFAIVAESFSGSIAVQLAERAPLCKAIVLVATFVRPPRRVPRWLVAIVSRLVFWFTPPRWAIRWWLAGRDAPESEIDEVRAVLASVAPAALAARLRRVMAKDVTDAFRRCAVPILYVQALRDRLLPRRVLRDLLAARPTMEHVAIDGPHLLVQRRAVEAAAAIAPFLQRCA